MSYLRSIFSGEAYDPTSEYESMEEPQSSNSASTSADVPTELYSLGFCIWLQSNFDRLINE